MDAGDDWDGNEEQPSEPTAQRRPLSAILVTVAVVLAAGAVALWWAWPNISGESDQLDVLVVADGFDPEARRPIELRVRELGKSISWLRVGSDRCESAARVVASVEQRSPDIVIVAAPPEGDCLTDAVAEVGGVTRVAVVPAGTSAGSAAAIDGFHVVDPIALVGASGAPVSMPCQWWEACPPDGQVVVRDVAGALTDAGHERLARAVVADL